MHCVFCRIVSGELPAYIIHQNDSTISFLDINPVNQGHCLVLPKEHCESLNELPPELRQPLMKAITLVSKAVTGAMGTDSFNLFLNNGITAGQIIPHVHFHVVPRFPQDGLYFKTSHQKFGDRAMEEFRQSIIKNLKDS